MNTLTEKNEYAEWKVLFFFPFVFQVVSGVNNESNYIFHLECVCAVFNSSEWILEEHSTSKKAEHTDLNKPSC